MSRKAKGDDIQLSLDLNEFQPEKVGAVPLRTRNVVSFIDAGTQEIRREAIRRVMNSGIFNYPKSNKKIES